MRRRRNRRVTARSRIRAQPFQVSQALQRVRPVPSDAAPVHVHLVVATDVSFHAWGETRAVCQVRQTVVGAVDDLGDADFVAVVEYPSTHDTQQPARSRYPIPLNVSFSYACVFSLRTRAPFSRKRITPVEERTALLARSAVSAPMEYIYESNE